MTEPQHTYLDKYPPAHLTEEQVQQLQKLERELTQQAGSPILLMAFRAQD
ncbi:hypothetical protein [Effusibacillus pohliae]|nr:hypothetical protein [Effusibacillus pohliae]